MRSDSNLVCAPLLALALVAGSSAAQSGSPDGLALVRELLTERDKGPDELALARDLQGLGPAFIPLFLDLLAERGWEELFDEGARVAEWRCSADRLPEVLIRALGAFPPALVIPELRLRLERSDTLEQRRIALCVIGSLGRAEGCALLLESAASWSEIELRSPKIQRELAAALEQALRRDPRTWHVVHQSLDALPEPTLPLLVDGLARARDPKAQPLFERLLGRQAELDRRLLEEMVRLETRFPWKLRGTTIDLLTSRCRSSDWRERRWAVTLLGELREADQVSALIDHLDDIEPQVGTTARAALASSTGVDLGADPERWSGWWESERVWWDSQAPEVLADLRGSDADRCGAALRALAQHPVFRHDLAEAIAASLAEQPPMTAVASCQILGQLGSLSCAPGLVAVLREEDAQLRSAAWHTLRALTAEELPLDVDLWTGYLDSP